MFLSCRRGAFAAYLLTSGSHSIVENELDLKGPILKLVEKVIFRSFFAGVSNNLERSDFDVIEGTSWFGLREINGK